MGVDATVYKHILPISMSTILQKDVTRFTTVEEYILFEEQSNVRHELINDQLIEMSGTTDDHNYICQNLVVLLRQLFKGTEIKVYNENVKVQITSEKDYTYPDIMVVPDLRAADQTISIPAIGAVFSLADVYEGVEWFVG
jgi:Uma2 family endonuclease